MNKKTMKVEVAGAKQNHSGIIDGRRRLVKHGAYLTVIPVFAEGML